MRTSTFVHLFLSFCAVWIDLANLKPIADFDDFPKGCVHSEQISNIRIPRSIPDMEAVNPSNLEADTDPQQSQEELSDPEKDNDVSAFALSDHVSEFFRSHKGKESQKCPQQGTGDRQDNLNKDDELVSREALSADEQIECYKQQNIEPPRSFDEPPRPLLKLKDQRPFTDVFENKEHMISRPLIYKEKGTKRLHDKDDDANEITSLYSEPEKRKKSKKQKMSNTQIKDYNSIDQLNHRSVFKPVGVKPEFPMYDEDIDFHPDPLQGVLEDKYWLDPQEQEAVIRKYIDLASNMQPPRVDYDKRDTDRLDHEPKSVDSKEAFRDAESVDRECPCREIAACGDCSRGKWKKKSNYSEREGDGSFYGNYGSRKLLSLSYDDIPMDGNERGTKKIEVDVESDGKGYIFQEEEHKFENNDLHTYGSFGVMGEDVEEENQIEGEVPSFTSKYFGRKLLSFEDDENIEEEEYGLDKGSKGTDYETSEDLDIKNIRLLDPKSESLTDYENEVETSDNKVEIVERDVNYENNIGSPVIVNPLNSSVYQYQLETENFRNENNYFNPNYTEEFIQMQKPFLNKPHNYAKYYVPNKFGNLFQKTFIKHKPKEASTTIDPDLEFAIERNETFLNVSIVMEDINVSVTTEMANLVKKNKRREQPIFHGGKGRRSYEVSHEKHKHINKLQGEDLGNVQNGNSTANVSSLINSTFPSTISTNGTDNTTGMSSIISSTVDTTTDTALSTNTTENGTTISDNRTTTAKPKKKIEDYDEDSFDAEIANDIVETVIAESQSGSVVGHNLGLCRRNDSISNYAKVSPESEQLLKKVTECILDRIRDRLEGQSCTLLDDELLQFLKWMVLSGESYKDYLARIRPELREFKSEVHEHFSGPAPPPNPDAQPETPVTTKQTS